MEKRKTLLLIFLFTLLFRLFFAFQTENFDYDAYFDIRQINEISDSGTPVYTDELSYGGRTLIFAPFFYYAMAFFDLFIPFALKTMPNIFASCLVFIVYLISKKLTHNEDLSLVAAFVSGFIPVFVLKTINSVSVYSLAIPLIFLMLYFIMEHRKYVTWFIISAFIISLTHQISFLLVIGLLIYLILVKLEHLEQSKAELELIIFTIFLVLWIMFLLFKNAFLTHGLSVIWQNLPNEIVSLYFGQTNIIIATISIGLLPLIGGIYVIYKYLFREKNKNIYLLISFALAITPLLWMKLIQLEIGLAFLGVVFVLLFSKYLELFVEYFQKTKVGYIKLGFILFAVLFFITSIIPTYYFVSQNVAISDSEINALTWIEENTALNATVIGSLNQGHAISAIAERRNVIDSNFLLIKNPTQRLEDVDTIYTTNYETEAVELLNKYDINYILTNGEKIPYVKDKKCFDLVFDEETKVYESKCALEIIK